MVDPKVEPDHHITERLIAWGNGEIGALEELMQAVYAELHRMADRHLRRERPGHSLQPTALVHEAYLRLVDQSEAGWQNRNQFFAVASGMMRRILVDHARSRKREKRGGGAYRLSLDEIDQVPRAISPDLVALDEALNRLFDIDPRKGRVVELRFFGGLSVEETAGVLAVSPQTVLRDWRLAKAWLYQEIIGSSR